MNENEKSHVAFAKITEPEFVTRIGCKPVPHSCDPGCTLCVGWQDKDVCGTDDGLLYSIDDLSPTPHLFEPVHRGANNLAGAAEVFFQNDKTNASASITLQDDAPRGTILGSAKLILDLIGFTEGTDKGDGYNETLAYGAFTNGDVRLTDMTLAEVDALQTQMLAHPKNSWSSSAVGRYQIVRTTLRKLKSTLQIADTLKFTPELQDTLAIELLKGRGYEAWRVGNITDTQFALNLSKEWASLPNPHSGHGFYSGQRAAVSYAKVELVLATAR